MSEQQRSNGGEDEAAYERELAALREISAAAEREVALRQQARGRIANPMHAVSTHATSSCVWCLGLLRLLMMHTLILYTGHSGA